MLSDGKDNASLSIYSLAGESFERFLRSNWLAYDKIAISPDNRYVVALQASDVDIFDLQSGDRVMRVTDKHISQSSLEGFLGCNAALIRKNDGTLLAVRFDERDMVCIGHLPYDCSHFTYLPMGQYYVARSLKGGFRKIELDIATRNSSHPVKISKAAHGFVENGVMDFPKFINDYPLLTNEFRSLYSLSAPSDYDAKGLFSFTDLDVQYGFVNSQALNWTIAQLDEIENLAATMSSEDLHRPLDPEDFRHLQDKLPGFKRMIQFREIIAHESFHAIQTFTLSSVFQLASAFQRINKVKTAFALFAAGSGVKFQFGQSIFEIADRIDNDALNVLKRYALTLDRPLKTVHRALRGDSSGLAAIHLIEGAAYAAQKLACQSAAIATFDIGSKPLYGKAWEIWQENGGNNEMAFLLAADVALRFGNLDHHYDDDTRPEALFRILADKALDIENYFPEDGMISAAIGLDLSLKGAFTTNPIALDYLRPEGKRKHVVDALAVPKGSPIGNAEIESLLEFSKKLILEIPRDICQSFRSVTSETFSDASCSDYIGGVGQHLYEALPALGTQNFMLHWIFFDEVRNDFASALEEGTSDETTDRISVGPLRMNSLEYRTLSSLVADLETFLLYSFVSNPLLPRCCQRDGVPKYFDALLECKEPDSLNMMCERNLGGTLRNIVTGLA